MVEDARREATSMGDYRAWILPDLDPAPLLSSHSGSMCLAPAHHCPAQWTPSWSRIGGHNAPGPLDGHQCLLTPTATATTSPHQPGGCWPLPLGLDCHQPPIPWPLFSLLHPSHHQVSLSPSFTLLFSFHSRSVHFFPFSRSLVRSRPLRLPSLLPGPFHSFGSTAVHTTIVRFNPRPTEPPLIPFQLGDIDTVHSFAVWLRIAKVNRPSPEIEHLITLLHHLCYIETATSD